MPDPGNCPACGAAVRPGQPWCTLCYQDLRVAGAPGDDAPAPHPADPADPPLPDASALALPLQRDDAPADVRALDRPAGPRWPCTTCGALNDYDDATCSTCGTAFLAAGEQRTTLVLPLVGDVAAVSRGRRLALALLVAVLIAGVLALLAAAGGALLG